MEAPPSGPGPPSPFSELPGWRDLVREPPLGAHILHIYEDPSREVEAATLFASEGLRKGERVCCVGSPRELASIRRNLEAGGIEVEPLIGVGTLALVRQLDLNGGVRPREETSRPALNRFIHDMFRDVPDRFPAVRWWGNRVARFFESGAFDRCLAFEQMCQERRTALPWSLVCAYDGRKLRPERHAAAFWDVLRNHSHLIPAGDLGVALELFPNGVVK
jgi:hypothetical protein